MTLHEARQADRTLETEAVDRRLVEQLTGERRLAALPEPDEDFDDNGFEGTRTVIDLSADGTSTAGVNPATTRDAFLLGGGSAINAVAIGSGVTVAYLEDNVQGGDGAFSTSADTFSDFTVVIEDKLVREVAQPPTGDVPEPTSLALLAIGVLGFGANARRRAKKG